MITALDRLDTLSAGIAQDRTDAPQPNPDGYTTALRAYLATPGGTMPAGRDYGLTGSPSDYDDTDPFPDLVQLDRSEPQPAPQDAPPLQFTLTGDAGAPRCGTVEGLAIAQGWLARMQRYKYYPDIPVFTAIVALVTAAYWDSLDESAREYDDPFTDDGTYFIHHDGQWLPVIIIADGDAMARQDNRDPEDVQTCGQIAEWEARGARLRRVSHPYTPSPTALAAAQRIYCSEAVVTTDDGTIRYFARIIDNEMAKAAR